jgi:hypothetical protein
MSRVTTKIIVALMIARSATMTSGCMPVISCTPSMDGCIY